MTNLKILNFGFWEVTTVDKIKEPERYLKESAEILDRLKVFWCFSFGTALGLYRDNGFIPGDSDVDINIYCNPKQVMEIEEAFEEKYNLVRVIRDDERKYQVAFMAEDGYIIDLSFFYYNLKNDSWFSHHEEGNYIDPTDVIGSSKQLDTKYGTYPVPELIEEYLKIRYGDWQTPKHGAINSSITQ